MNVLFVAAEAAPFAKVGGMADVVGSLPAALRRIGLDARVMIPGYGFIEHFKYKVQFLFGFDLPRKTGTTHVKVYAAEEDGVPIYLVQGWPFIGDEPTVYSDWHHDMPRFIFFSQAALAAAQEIGERLGWFPEVFHVNDWHTGLVPFLIEESRNDTQWRNIASLLSIHNMAYQGNYAGGWLWELGIAGRHQPDLVYQDLTDNLMAIAITYSDIITTVSPRYAIEIQYPYQGYGLDGLIRRRVNDVYGILNGIDVNLWNPATDPHIISHFNAQNFLEKRPPNKTHLQQEAGLPVRDDVLVIGVVSRLVWQKGIDMAVPALRELLSKSDVQLVALGTGEKQIEYELGRLGRQFPHKARTWLKYSDALAQHIYAGCDLFLMPSHFEPCGTGQMLAMRYGALPLVRETGGLADTVQNYDNGQGDIGTGFVFTWEQPNAVGNTLRWAMETYYSRKEAWRKMQQRAMQVDFSWEKSANQYANLYRKAIERRKGSS
jgi:starch synthase